MSKRKRQARPQGLAVLAVIAVAVMLLGGAMQALGGSGRRAAEAAIRFSRVMTGNPSACYPVEGRFYDWIELENPSDRAVNLRGWLLSDDIDLRGAYRFGDATIPAGGTLIVYCAPRPEGLDPASDALFTGFKLSSDGELLLLADARERVADSLAVPALKAGWVYRRDAGGEWGSEPMTDGTAAGATAKSPAFAQGSLYINEMMPSNHSTLTDADGDLPDWIELHNGGSAPVNLEGFGLSVKGGADAAWRLPAVSLGPDEYLVVFASGKNRADGDELHANFRLSADGCAVRLYDRTGTEISRLSCEDVGADTSVSRTGEGAITLSWPATPGWRNSETGVPDEMPLLTGNALNLYINELQNVKGGSDWVELHNAGATDVDLTGMGLSDNLARPRRWQFPQGARVPAGGYVVVSLPGSGAAADGSAAYAADFGIATGETLCLSTPDGQLIDQVKIYPQPASVSFGRADGESRYRYFAQATPGAPNGGATYARQTSPVAFSVPGGAHPETSLTVALSSDSGAAIYYTTDGTEPTPSSALYQAPIALTQNTAIRAVAYKNGELPSPAGASTYILGRQHPNMYVACITGDYEALIGPNGALNTGMKKDDCDVYVEIYDPSGAPMIGQACNFMVSGHSSRQKNAQKAFRLKARAAYGDNLFRAKLFTKRDYAEFKALTLRASGQDCTRTHMLDSVLTSLADATSVMYLETEVAVVYVNGQYWGVYNLRERVTAHAVAQFEGWDDPDDVILVRNGKSEQGSTASYNSLMQWVSGADLSQQANLDQLRQYVDVENYLDYVALEIYTSNLDLSNVRCYCNPAKGGKWRWILFDLDLSYQVDRNTPRDWLAPGGVGTITQQDNTLFVKLMQNSGVRDYFLRRCGELLRTDFSADSVIARIQARYELLKPEMEENCARWGWTTDSWTSHGKKFIDFARTRPGKLVGYFASAFQLSDAEVQTYFAGVQ